MEKRSGSVVIVKQLGELSTGPKTRTIGTMTQPTRTVGTMTKIAKLKRTSSSTRSKATVVARAAQRSVTQAMSTNTALQLKNADGKQGSSVISPGTSNVRPETAIVTRNLSSLETILTETMPTTTNPKSVSSSVEPGSSSANSESSEAEESNEMPAVSGAIFRVRGIINSKTSVTEPETDSITQYALGLKTEIMKPPSATSILQPETSGSIFRDRSDLNPGTLRTLGVTQGASGVKTATTTSMSPARQGTLGLRTKNKGFSGSKTKSTASMSATSVWKSKTSAANLKMSHNKPGTAALKRRSAGSKTGTMASMTAISAFNQATPVANRRISGTKSEHTDITPKASYSASKLNRGKNLESSTLGAVDLKQVGTNLQTKTIRVMPILSSKPGIVGEKIVASGKRSADLGTKSESVSGRQGSSVASLSHANARITGAEAAVSRAKLSKKPGNLSRRRGSSVGSIRLSDANGGTFDTKSKISGAKAGVSGAKIVASVKWKDTLETKLGSLSRRRGSSVACLRSLDTNTGIAGGEAVAKLKTFDRKSRVSVAKAGNSGVRSSSATAKRALSVVRQTNKISMHRASSISIMKSGTKMCKMSSPSATTPLTPKKSSNNYHARKIMSSERIVQCPFKNCDYLSGEENFLKHTLDCHLGDLLIEPQTIYNDQKIVLSFNPKEFEYVKNICVGLLLYGGVNEDPKNFPGALGLCVKNKLGKTLKPIEMHLPVVIMACRTSWDAIMKTEEVENETTEKLEDVLFLWLASLQTSKQIQYNMTVSPSTAQPAPSFTKIMRIRYLTDCQCPDFFVHTDTNHLVLSTLQMNSMALEESNSLCMEITMNGFN